MSLECKFNCALHFAALQRSAFGLDQGLQRLAESETRLPASGIMGQHFLALIHYT